MGMKFKLQYHELILKKDISKLSLVIKNKIKGDIEKKLLSHPEKFGKPLRRSLKGYRKLRSGDYRIIFRIEENIIKILMIEHRSVVYKKGLERLKN